MNSVTYDQHFSFRQKYLTFHVLIHLTCKAREQLGNANIFCGIFIALQNAYKPIIQNQSLEIKKQNLQN